jgi:predicted TIM-barrel fold metal-dependent hydrolase
VYLDLSGSGVDRGMLDNAYAAVGAGRLLWGADITLCTGLAKLWALEVIGLTPDEMADVRWRNAARIFSHLRSDAFPDPQSAPGSAVPVPSSRFPVPSK